MLNLSKSSCFLHFLDVGCLRWLVLGSFGALVLMPDSPNEALVLWITLVPPNTQLLRPASCLGRHMVARFRSMNTFLSTCSSSFLVYAKYTQAFLNLESVEGLTSRVWAETWKGLGSVEYFRNIEARRTIPSMPSPRMQILSLISLSRDSPCRPNTHELWKS